MNRSLQLLLTTALLLLISGCQNASFIQKPKVTAANLPKPTNIKTLASTNAVALEWEYKNSTDVDGYRVYRSNKSGKLEAIATLKNRFASHYTDTGLEAEQEYSYALASVSTDGAESETTALINIKTLPPFEPISFIAGVNNLPNLAKIVWRPHTNMVVGEYEIQRFDIAKSAWAQIASVKPRLLCEYIDKDVDSGKTYRYRIIAKGLDGSYSKPSAETNVSTKKLPPSPESITASKDQPRQIEVRWQAAPDSKHENFKLYGAKTVDGNFELLTTTREATYLDKIAGDGELRYYKVSAVDKDLLESPTKNVAAGMTKPLPKTPNFTLATIRENKVMLNWICDDKEVAKYRITRRSGSVFAKDIVEINDITGLQFLDKDVDLGVKYLYRIESIDKDGLVSKPSDEVELFVPKG